MKTTIGTFAARLLTLSVCISVGQAQDGPDSSYVITRDLGPFMLGRDKLMNVYARITHVHLRSQEADGWPDSDTLLILSDDAGRTLYEQRAHTTLGGAETDYKCKQSYIPTIGNVLICSESTAPSMDDGDSFHMFGVNSKGQFVLLAPLVPKSDYRVVFLDSRKRRNPIVVDTLNPYATPVIEVEFWSGYYSVKMYYIIYPQGYSIGKQRRLMHFDEIPVSIEPEDLSQTRGYYTDRDSVLSLFPSPKADRSEARRITVHSDSKIKCLYASYVRDWWLFVSIDGHEGYITGDDCYTLGCPSTSGTPIALGDDY